MLRRSFITPRNDSRIFAFTLAEVLITLVIIGIIAALTIPNLLQKYQEQATVKKVQKFYSTLSNAYSLAMKENGTANEWGLTGFDEASATKIYEILFKPYFKIAKNCGTTWSQECFTNTIKFLNGYVSPSSRGIAGTSAYYKILLDDGSSVAWYTSTGTNLYVILDVNGPKGPNQWGVDYFYFARHNNKILPLGLVLYGFSYGFNSYCQKNTTESYSGYGCAAWVVYKGNMDYLHCDGLTWNSRSCKEK